MPRKESEEERINRRNAIGDLLNGRPPIKAVARLDPWFAETVVVINEQISDGKSAEERMGILVDAFPIAMSRKPKGQSQKETTFQRVVTVINTLSCWFENKEKLTSKSQQELGGSLLREIGRIVKWNPKVSSDQYFPWEPAVDLAVFSPAEDSALERVNAENRIAILAKAPEKYVRTKLKEYAQKGGNYFKEILSHYSLEGLMSPEGIETLNRLPITREIVRSILMSAMKIQKDVGIVREEQPYLTKMLTILTSMWELLSDEDQCTFLTADMLLTFDTFYPDILTNKKDDIITTITTPFNSILMTKSLLVNIDDKINRETITGIREELERRVKADPDIEFGIVLNTWHPATMAFVEKARPFSWKKARKKLAGLIYSSKESTSA